jgi:hypothetical protein
MKIYLTISAKALSINKQAVPENKWPGMSSQSATSNQSNGAPITSFTPDASD